MYQISDDEIDYIIDDIKTRGVTIEDLQLNLLDHVCCIIESEKPDTQDFYEFYKNTIARFFKKDLKEIEEETNNLLTFKNYYAMKRTLKTVGLISAIFMIVGSFFKVMHWPGAGILLVSFMMIFSLVFLPLLIVMKLKDDVSAIDKVLFGFGAVLGISASLGTLFKIMHWPGANVLMVGSTVLFLVVFIPFYLILRLRNTENRFNTVLNSTLMLAAGGMLFSLMNLGSSKSVDDSIMSVHYFLDGNTQLLESSNSKLYTEVAVKDQNGYARQLHENSQKLDAKIKELKALLVAQAEQVSEEQATSMNIDQVRNLKNSAVIRKFENGMYKIKPKDIYSMIKEYNNSIDPDVNHPINVEHLQLHHTNLGLIYHQLTQIQMQLAMNENSYLQYVNGTLAKM